LDGALRNRTTPPLAFYVAAPFVGLRPGDPFFLRLPFAVAGLLCVAFLLFWLWRDRAPLGTWILVGLALSGNVAFVLYARQGRYYTLATLLTLVLAFLHLHPRGDGSGQWRRAIAMAIAAILLMLSNYLAWVAVCPALALDHAIWE